MTRKIDTPEELAALADITIHAARRILAALDAAGYRIARKPGRPVVRDAGSGRYVEASAAERAPGTTVRET